jgi:UDP-N-acetylglucosamine--N-acetylmuramyl-(pentapeptide) pyrophosphoryl-undecaprenol N-acetylglucosamine transferase
MKIVFTGGGTGGHFYPIIAVAESVRSIADKEKIVDLDLYYYSDAPYDKAALFENGIEFREVTAGKLRIYFSFQNFIDMFKTGIGIIQAIFSLFVLYPDVVFSKGGYGSFPVVCAARILGIPVVLHESDTVPGRVNRWTGKFARRVALSYDEAGQYFPEKNVALTGQPIRKSILDRRTDGAFEYLKLDPSMPTILVLGGSLGAEAINNAILDALPQLLTKYQVIHQTGIANFEEVHARSKFLIGDDPVLASRYRPFAFLTPLALKMSAGAATLIISRAGSAIFEIASWGVPSILIPIETSYGDHQKKNAFNYARHGAAIVIGEGNLSPNIIVSETNRLLGDKALLTRMSEAAKHFATPDAADKIARALLEIGLSHEK